MNRLTIEYQSKEGKNLSCQLMAAVFEILELNNAECKSFSSSSDELKCILLENGKDFAAQCTALSGDKLQPRMTDMEAGPARGRQNTESLQREDKVIEDEQCIHGFFSLQDFLLKRYKENRKG